MDLNVYARMMNADSYNSFFSKEFIFFYGQRFLFILTNSTYFSFILFDLIFCILMLLAFRNFNLPLYAYFTIFIFLPFFLGSQNIIRQNYAAQLVMFAVSLSGTFRPFFLLVASAFIHNISALFLVLVANTRIRFFLACVFLFGCLQIIFLFYNSKVKIDTGFDFSVLLVIATLSILILILRYDRSTSKFVVYSQFIIVIFIFFILSSGQIERVCYFILLINYPMIIGLIEKFSPKEFPRLLFVIFNVCIIFFASAPKSFLF
jgi:hypothetical protein